MAIVSYYEDGVQVIDISDPSNPRLVGYFDTFPNNNGYQGYFGCWGVYPFLPSGNIIASDRKYGLHVLRFKHPDTFENGDVSIFPNPSVYGRFNFVVNKTEGEEVTLEVFNVAGQIILDRQLTNTFESIDLNALPAGVYVARIKIRDQEVIKKLVKAN